MDTFFLDLETKWMNAWKNKDEITARELLADEFTLTSSLSNQLVNKEGWINKAINNYHCRNFEFKEIQTRVYGDTAILNIIYNQQATANDKDWSGDFLLTDVWVKKDEKWQVVTRHSSWLQNS